MMHPASHRLTAELGSSPRMTELNKQEENGWMEHACLWTVNVLPGCVGSFEVVQLPPKLHIKRP